MPYLPHCPECEVDSRRCIESVQSRLCALTAEADAVLRRRADSARLHDGWFGPAPQGDRFSYFGSEFSTAGHETWFAFRDEARYKDADGRIGRLADAILRFRIDQYDAGIKDAVHFLAFAKGRDRPDEAKRGYLRKLQKFFWYGLGGVLVVEGTGWDISWDPGGAPPRRLFDLAKEVADKARLAMAHREQEVFGCDSRNEAQPRVRADLNTFLSPDWRDQGPAQYQALGRRPEHDGSWTNDDRLVLEVKRCEDGQCLLASLSEHLGVGDIGLYVRLRASDWRVTNHYGRGRHTEASGCRHEETRARECVDYVIQWLQERYPVQFLEIPTVR